MSEYAGIKITGTADRTAVQFNNVIDLSEPVMHKLIELIVTPDRQDKGEFEQLCITLTDTTDPSCWLTVSLYRDTWGYEYLTRVTVTSSANPYYMGYQYAQRQYYSSNRNGTEIRHTFDGRLTTRLSPFTIMPAKTRFTPHRPIAEAASCVYCRLTI